MVSVRKSHQIAEQSFEQWLTNLALTEVKAKALSVLWLQICNFYQHDSAVKFDLQHKSMEMVEILSGLNLDADSLVAAFISPLLEHNIISIDYVKEHLSKDILMLCQGVEQMAAIKALRQQSHKALGSTPQNIDNIRRMLLAMVDDVRAVVIKLAERLCDLRAKKNSDEETRVLAAKESANIYAPLANRLGIGQLKWELEDISFRYLHPQVYKKIAKLLDETRLEREQYMASFVGQLKSELNALAIKGDVFGRPKHIYSIWKKMQQKSLGFEQLFDVRAVRVVVEKVQDCYSALGIVHTQWPHLAKEFSDYVATPKANGYQSIHTVVLGPTGKSVEVQIRTKQMDDDAELGVAAHWRYKEGTASGKNNSFDDKIGWLRKILQWQDDVSESGELLDELRSQVFEDRIYVFTPSGDVIDLPMGATPLDFAYYIHSNVGHCCIGAKVFGKIVPFTHQLQTGDQVEILTSKQPNPSRDWLNPNLNYIYSSRARAKVQHFFKLLDRDKYIAQGKELFDSEIAKYDLATIDLLAAAKRFNMKTIDDLYVALATGNARLQQVINHFTQLDSKLKPQAEIDPQSLVKQSPTSKTLAQDDNGITVSGVGNLLTHMAKCCQPVPGDTILGFITQGRGISVHRQDCEQLANALSLQAERLVEVQWGNAHKQSYQATAQIIGSDRQGLLRDISTIIANERVSIIGMESHTDKAKQTMSMKLKLEVENSELLLRVLDKLRQLDDVSQVRRL
ncbi:MULTISPECIES: GTP diphosphokinase [Colwellia]|uniref:GTP pyrophosphokinase n=1 Tax=Colwellia marinimaniae TaxID=1513592 RepID=A0ABQ0MU79_9GAMM|nr:MULTISPECIES: GTP diphosphokinase [Colwellia]GAW95897.1 GTP pyrophosphokinase [Colwellia marinimaniae]